MKLTFPECFTKTKQVAHAKPEERIATQIFLKHLHCNIYFHNTIHNKCTLINLQIFERKSNHDTFQRIVGPKNKLLKSSYRAL